MSPTDHSRPVPQRRRGAQLEDALLDAAWGELLDVGYEALTYDAVAERARTSRAVLYRRWPTKRDLAVAAVSRVLAAQPSPTPDTGTLRGDVIALLHAANDARARVAVQLAARLDGPHEGGLTLADVRDTLSRRSDDHVRTILGRARDRGEIPTADLPRRVRNVAFHLLGYHVLMTRRAATAEEIAEVVDEVFLPLVRGRGA
ncbi:TetR family transcriptional regulator [Cellulosimicrobium cellulans J34]|nr:TetR family transcriptional regulator [Cellulosimicrobium cellulans J34]SME89062.1 transcriptional regulator, TetR family [Cellulosimicrobium cellulans J1]